MRQGNGKAPSSALLMLGGVLTTDAILFALGGVVGGAGGGAAFRGALARAEELAPPDGRGEASAGVFVGAYLGMALPVLGIGFTSEAGWPLARSLVAFVLVVLALVAVLGVGGIVHRPTGFSRTARLTP